MVRSSESMGACAHHQTFISLSSVSHLFFHIPPLPLFLVMEMINDSSEEAWDKATRADRRERETSFIPASVQRHRFTEFTNCERNEMRLLSLIALRIHLRSLIVLATYRLSEKKTHTTLSFFFQGQALGFCNATVLCDSSFSVILI